MATRSKAARLLGVWVEIPPGACMSVSCECCVLSGRGLCVGLITRSVGSYWVWRVWVWSWSLDNEETLGHKGQLCHGRKWGGGGGYNDKPEPSNWPPSNKTSGSCKRTEDNDHDSLPLTITVSFPILASSLYQTAFLWSTHSPTHDSHCTFAGAKYFIQEVCVGDQRL